MDPIRIGSDVRLLRLRRGWSQQRLADEARTSRWIVAQVERGRCHRVPLERLIAVVATVGAYLSVRILFQGEGMDRLRDRRHATLVEAMVKMLQADGWDVATEVSFNIFGERGSIDILAFHPLTHALLVIEVKTVVPDVGGLLSTLDRKVRLASDIARGRGWHAVQVSRLLVLPEASTARRRVRDHDATFTNAFPTRNVAVNAWLRSPSGTVAGLLFLSTVRETRARRNPRHARAPEDRRPRTISS